ncbi:GGDEF domain-containing protein [Aquisalimonas asiatica]|uniref:diguanylate cyclase n=1 Tax=Aquisalimonas asiatica TaxID=406100 RepID=A0A1H8QVQ2_9GAMM|nr:GGDEF domain-containing protein [Aquisalimonas asiatica]SEO58339.1 diguanylate cyclase (GGDEF) domain-containing protein [Aquisalimonas asiatica]
MKKAVESVSRAQSLRLQRTLWGFLAQLCMLLILASMALAGFMEPIRVAHVALMHVGLVTVYVILIRSGVNLHLNDPSMTGAQVTLSLLPAMYAMYHLQDPQLRVAVVLMATVGMLFAALAYDTRRLLWLGGYHVLAYVLLIGALAQWAPERLNLRAEGPVLLTYALVVIMICLLGGFIAGLRRTLRQRNTRLEVALAELQDLATLDPLTRLPNRRAALEQLRTRSAQARFLGAGSTDVAVGLVDIDLFKQVNDTFGHQAGDMVLCRVGDALRASLRQDDFIGRFGGEEFLLILSDADPGAARQTAERLRQTILALQFPELPDDHDLTISVGITLLAPDETTEAALFRADRALYDAKDRGRNATVLLMQDDTNGTPAATPAPHGARNER